MTAPIRVLHLSAEVVPFSKTGGLADVAGALPPEQRGLEGYQRIDARVLTPLYGFIDPARWGLKVKSAERYIRLGGQIFKARLWADAEDHTWFIDCPGLLDRPTPYGAPGQPPYADNPLRFAVMCKVAADLADDFDVVHLHDWHAGLAAAYLQGKVPTIQTIHNMAYLGLCDPAWADRLEIPQHLRGWQGMEFHGQLSMLKAGLVCADMITTVSPRYAQEIQGEPGGQGLSGLLAHRGAAVRGILNGIDEVAWDPANDAALAAPYSLEAPEGRATCRETLLKMMSFSPDPQLQRPIMGVVARGTYQKGFDLLVDAAPTLVAQGVRLVVLTAGEPSLVERVRGLAVEHPDAVALYVGFDDGLARRIYAGSDCVLVPSRFEPCGLTQLIGMRYGSVPIVRATGGLADTVEHGVTGFTFDDATPEALLSATDAAVKHFGDRTAWRAMQARCMAQDWSWAGPVRSYHGLYSELLSAPSGVKRSV
ncbi:MAG: glycogen synthase [Bradymonadia bacterium]